MFFFFINKCNYLNTFYLVNLIIIFLILIYIITIYILSITIICNSNSTWFILVKSIKIGYIFILFSFLILFSYVDKMFLMFLLIFSLLNFVINKIKKTNINLTLILQRILLVKICLLLIYVSTDYQYCSWGTNKSFMDIIIDMSKNLSFDDSSVKKIIQSGCVTALMVGVPYVIKTTITSYKAHQTKIFLERKQRVDAAYENIFNLNFNENHTTWKYLKIDKIYPEAIPYILPHYLKVDVNQHVVENTAALTATMHLIERKEHMLRTLEPNYLIPSAKYLTLSTYGLLKTQSINLLIFDYLYNRVNAYPEAVKQAVNDLLEKSDFLYECMHKYTPNGLYYHHKLVRRISSLKEHRLVGKLNRQDLEIYKELCEFLNDIYEEKDGFDKGIPGSHAIHAVPTYTLNYMHDILGEITSTSITYRSMAYFLHFLHRMFSTTGAIPITQLNEIDRQGFHQYFRESLDLYYEKVAEHMVNEDEENEHK